MKYCSACSAPNQQSVPSGDNRERAVCTSCNTIHYQNPNNVCGCILQWQGKVLLCKRAIEPRHGYWTLPAGFMENNETTMQGAAREAFEEANATALDLRLFGLYNLPRISQVYLMFAGDLENGYIKAGEESLEVGLFSESEIPWSELAFPVITESLQRYFENPHKVYVADLRGKPGADIEVTRY